MSNQIKYTTKTATLKSNIGDIYEINSKKISANEVFVNDVNGKLTSVVELIKDAETSIGSNVETNVEGINISIDSINENISNLQISVTTNTSAIDTLNGVGEGSVSKTVSDAVTTLQGEIDKKAAQTDLEALATKTEISVIEEKIDEVIDEVDDLQGEIDTINDEIAEIKNTVTDIVPKHYIKTVSVTGSGETSGETELTIKDGRTVIFENDIWDNTVSMSENNIITIHGGDIDASLWSLKNGYNTKGAVTVDEVEYTIGTNTLTKVDDDSIYNGETKIANYKSSEVKNGSHLFHNTTLSLYDGNLDSLTNGEWMFANTDLENWENNMNELENAESMFRDCSSLKTFTGDMNKASNASYMFRNCSALETFIGDTSSLKNAEQMFYYCIALTAVIGDLSSVTNGSDMFSYCYSLASFDSDLSSLTNGVSMF